MEEKDKYHAEIDAKLVRLGETLHEIKTKTEQRKQNLSEISIDNTLQKYNNAKTKLEQLKQSDETRWHHRKSELENYINAIDDDLRKALVYFAQ